MSRFHDKSQQPKDETKHLNFMAGASYFSRNPLTTLRIAAASCFFGEPQYYRTDAADHRAGRSFGRAASVLGARELTHLRSTLDALDPQEWRGLTPAEVIESAIDAALDFDAEGTLREAVRLRNEDHIRTTPQVILVRASRHAKVRGTGLIRRYAPGIITRADEPAVGLAYYLWRFGTKAPLPNSLKRAWKFALEHFTEYQLAKYRMDAKGVKTVDVVNLVHANSPAIAKLMQGELKTTDQTWESIISSEGSTAETWKKALNVMGHMALLRNVRNLLQKGVDPKLFVQALIDGAANGKQLPFRYFSAYKAVESAAPPQVLDALETCLMDSVGRLPRFSGRVASLCDNSGSAWGAMTSSAGTMAVAEIANLTGILTGMAADEGYVGIFGDRLEMIPVRKKASVFDQLKKAIQVGKGIGGATENGVWLFWDKAIREKQHWDHVFIYSDMQAGHGGLFGTTFSAYRDYAWPGDPRMIDVAKLVQKYRATVNPKVNVYLVQVAGYTDTILPEYYNRTFIMGGWGEGVLRFAASMAQLLDGQAPPQPGKA
jgi:hypothetical protein